MKTKPYACGPDRRFVGDPVDVITGALVDARIDFQTSGSIPFEWTRYYSSSRNSILGSLGRGHFNEFERVLQRDLDGLKYVRPNGAATEFPELKIGKSAAGSGYKITRTAFDRYSVVRASGHSEDYVFFEEYRGLPVRIYHGTQSIELKYNGDGQLEQILDSRKRNFRLTWNLQGTIKTLGLVASTNSHDQKILVEYFYDSKSNLIGVRDIYETRQSFEYDSANRLIRRTDRNGYSFHFQYDSNGRCTYSSGEDGLFEVTLEYSPESRRTLVRRSDGGNWIYFYSDGMQLTQIVDPYGSATRFVFDDDGRLIGEIDPSGNCTHLHYNWLGEHDYCLDPNGNPIPTREMDTESNDPLAYSLPNTPLEWEFGKLLNAAVYGDKPTGSEIVKAFTGTVFNDFVGVSAQRQTDLQEQDVGPGTKIDLDDFSETVQESYGCFSESWKFDLNGNPIQHIDQDGRITQFEYHSWNLLRRVIDPIGRTTTYDYNRQGLISRITDAGGTTSEFEYDLRDDLIRVTRSGQLRETYKRDACRNIVAKLDSHGRKLVDLEIGKNNLVKSRRLASGEEQQFKHDDQGRVVSAKFGKHEIRIAYSVDGQVASDKRDSLGVEHMFEGGGLTQTQSFSRFATTYNFQNAGHLTIQDSTGTKHSLRYTNDGLFEFKLANNIRLLSKYNDKGRCIRKFVEPSPFDALHWTRRYDYSFVGDLVAIVDNNFGDSKYGYDASHHLAWQKTPGSATTEYVFDGPLNLLKQPNLKNVSIESRNRVSVANEFAFSYDDRDRVSQIESRNSLTKYYYNELDLLVSATIDGAPWSAEYDPYCRRISKTWCGKTTTYYWDDFRLCAEILSTGVVRLYIYADNTSLVPFMFIEYADMDQDLTLGEKFYIHTNQIGVPVSIMNTSGKACWNARIEPYGMANIEPGYLVDMPLRFPGHYFDLETGLHYNRFRYYSPQLGRYLQPDPVDVDGGVNLYSYVQNPLTQVDIDGLGKGRQRSGSNANVPKHNCRSPIPQAGVRPPPSVPFEGVPPIRGKTTGQIRQGLRDAGFQNVPNNRGNSEIWRRTRPDGSVEQVRIDAKGHDRRPDQAHLPKATTSEPHAHKERFPPGRDPDQHAADKHDDHGTHVQIPGGNPQSESERRELAQRQREAHEAVHIPIKG